jgi:tRNA-Thr(GGU) m(6)t(6)A37 methyltransferase TsaA
MSGGVVPGDYAIHPIGYIRSVLRDPQAAPKQGAEGAPDAWLDLAPFVLPAARGLAVGQRIVVITWLHRADRGLLEVRPRDDVRNPLTGVFATRSADRPNPLGLHLVTIREITGSRLRIGPIEAIDGTPVVDVKIDLPG